MEADLADARIRVSQLNEQLEGVCSIRVKSVVVGGSGWWLVVVIELRLSVVWV